MRIREPSVGWSFPLGLFALAFILSGADLDTTIRVFTNEYAIGMYIFGILWWLLVVKNIFHLEFLKPSKKED